MDGCHIAFIDNLWILWGSIFFLALMVGRRQLCMMLISRPLWKMPDFIFHENKPMSFHPLFYSLHPIKSTLCYHSMAFACWQTFSSLTPLELIWFHWLLFLMGLLQWLQLYQKDDFYCNRLVTNIIFPSSYRGFQMFTPISKHVSSLMCQHGMKNERQWKLSSFSFMLIL
jgi:hypothetical protein